MTDPSIIYQVDAFTNQPFSGNPAGVMLLDKALDEQRMQQLAAEMNLSETAFVVPDEEHFIIRYFTPKVEIPLCGHATLASAHLMYQLGMKKEKESIHFRSKAGALTVSKEGEWLSMNFPSYAVQPVSVPPDFKTCLGIEPLEVYSSSGWLIGIAASEEDVLRCQPHFEQMKSKGLGMVMITATGKEADYVVRCFAPEAGINEDPVTGSAQCALAPLWHLKTGNTSFHALQLSERRGVLKVAWKGDRVEIKGQCCTVFKAVLEA